MHVKACHQAKTQTLKGNKKIVMINLGLTRIDPSIPGDLFIFIALNHYLVNCASDP